MRFAPELRKTTPSTPSEAANEATHKWVERIVSAFEKKDAEFVTNLYEDSDDIRLVLESVAPAKGKEAVKAAYEWMFQADSEHFIPDWELRSATTVGNQVMFTMEATNAEEKGMTKKDTRTHLFAEKSILAGQEDKIKTLTLYGDYMKAWVDQYEARASKERPDFAAISGHQ